MQPVKHVQYPEQMSYVYHPTLQVEQMNAMNLAEQESYGYISGLHIYV